MYLISVYFDEKTDAALRRMMIKIAENCGNDYMLRGNVPPHMTISAFEGGNEELVIDCLGEFAEQLKKSEVYLASAGCFPGVIFLSAVLNAYLHDISVGIHRILNDQKDIQISRFYQPFQWMPHITLGKKLTQNEMQEAFRILYSEIQMMKGQIVKIGLARTNPYHNLKEWELQ